MGKPIVHEAEWPPADEHPGRATNLFGPLESREVVRITVEEYEVARRCVNRIRRQDSAIHDDLLGRFERLELRDGDVLVFQLQRRIPCRGVEQMKGQIEDALRDTGKKNVKVLVIDADMKLEAVIGRSGGKEIGEMVELGDRVKDRISGFEGTAISRTEYLNGCIRVGVQPVIDKDGKLPEAQWFDEQQLQVLEEVPKKGEPEKRPGGPRQDAVRAADPDGRNGRDGQGRKEERG